MNENKNNTTLGGNGWSEWKQFVLNELSRQNEVQDNLKESRQEIAQRILDMELKMVKNEQTFKEKVDDKIANGFKDINNKIDKLSEDVVGLRIKAATWGAIAGLISAVIPFFANLVVMYFTGN